MLKENRFYFKNSEVPLTKLEIKLFKYLIKNINRTIDYQELVSNVWDDKNCTIYSIRNVVNKIREKSYYEIISNISKRDILLIMTIFIFKKLWYYYCNTFFSRIYIMEKLKIMKKH